MYQYILFDLDGTLTDSKEGITKSAQYALRSFGIEEKNLDKLEPFIGPPLSDSFREFYGMNEADTEKAVRTFRERFETVGITENKIYPGVKEMLQELKDNGCLLAIASSKPEVSVHRVLQMFEIEQYFSIIVGSLKDGTRTTKIEVMEETFAQLKKRVGRAYSEKKVLMVGDRKFDIEGARHFGVDSVGVTYGYANDGELTKAGATYLAEDPQAVASLITGKKPYQKYADMSSLKKTLEILAPLAAYWLIQLAVYNILYYVLAKSGEVSAVCSAWLNVAAALATWPYVVRCYQKSRIPDCAEVVTRRKKKRLIREWGLIACYGISLALFLNLFISLLQLAQNSASYQKVAGAQYGISLPLGLLVYGLVMPCTEELLFRGVIYNRIKKYFPRVLAMLLSGLVFGCYHGNPVQILYASLMGLAMALVYESYGRISAPILFHISANAVVYTCSKLGFFAGGTKTMFCMILMLGLSLLLTYWYAKGLFSKFISR